MDQNTKPVPSVRAALTELRSAVVAELRLSVETDGAEAYTRAVNRVVRAADEAEAALAAPFGLTLEQESKYNVNDFGKLINRATGKPIPDDEPTMLFRAQDVHTRAISRRYFDLIEEAVIGETRHKSVLFERYQRFVHFADTHPERMKKPD